MLDMEILTSKVKGAMKKMFFDGAKAQPDYSHVIETDFEHDKHKSKLDERYPNMNCYGDFSDPTEMKTCEMISADIEAALRDFYKTDKIRRLVFPDSLLSHVSEDILRMSLAEPCGIQGCAINIMVQGKGKSQRLKTIYENLSRPPTFEIYLTLREDTRSWRQFQKVFLTIKGCIVNSQWTAVPIILRSGFQLEKRRLYRSASTEMKDL